MEEARREYLGGDGHICIKHASDSALSGATTVDAYCMQVILQVTLSAPNYTKASLMQMTLLYLERLVASEYMQVTQTSTTADSAHNASDSRPNNTIQCLGIPDANEPPC